MDTLYGIIGAAIAIAISGIVSVVLVKKSNDSNYYADYVFKIRNMLLRTEGAMLVNATMLNDGSNEQIEDVDVDKLSVTVRGMSLDSYSRYR
ncbi:MAG: hypothetical protein LBH28_06410 [Oscillospiraceae bacterium]|nr:hypothetical protein [Oscillospiraceae bacterium]